MPPRPYAPAGAANDLYVVFCPMNRSHVSSPLDDDLIQPFQIDASHLRGRLVRMGGMLDDILRRHDYPDPVARLLGETLTLAAVLAGALKYDGIFTLQTKGDGPISMMVADVTSVGDMRGYAQFDRERLDALEAEDGTVRSLLGKGYLAFTVDQGQHTERYQGIVELSGETLQDCVQHYFRQSEQLETGIAVAVGRDAEGGWRSGALMLQRLPTEVAGQPTHRGSDVEDDWRRAMVLMGTCSSQELLDPGLRPNDLLFRLFHEDGVRVYQPVSLRPGCRCSRDRVETVLRSLPRDEVVELKTDDGTVDVTCEFCNTTYSFTDDQLDTLYGA